MAISPMKRLAILAPINELDELLVAVQGLEQLEIIDLQEIEKWDELPAETSELLNELQKDEIHPHKDQGLVDELNHRLHGIERAIETIEDYLPSPSFWQKMKTGKKTVTYDQIEHLGERVDDQALVDRIHQDILRLDELEDLIDQRRSQYDELYPWRDLQVTPNELRKFQYVRGVIGSIPSTNDDHFFNFLKEDDDLEYEVVYIDEHNYGVIVFIKGEAHQYAMNELKKINSLLSPIVIRNYLKNA